MHDIDVVIVGGGLAGASAAYHLAQAGIESVIYEAGKVAQGTDNFLSGTAGPMMPAHSKMSTVVFESTADEFSRENGFDAAQMYVRIAQQGIDMQKSIAQKLNPQFVRELGVVAVASKDEWPMVEADEVSYSKLGVDVRLQSRDDVASLFGSSEYVGGLLFPQDVLIDAAGYVRKITEKTLVIENTRVCSIDAVCGAVIVKTQSKGQQDSVKARNAIIATNGFYEDANLVGLLTRAWSFIVCFEDEGPNTPAGFTLPDDYIDFLRQDNIFQVGGCQDVPVNGQLYERPWLDRLAKMARQAFPSLNNAQIIAEHFGQIAYTQDRVPIVGKFDEKSNVVYIVGCNAIGQSMMSYGASLIPGLLGFSKLTPEQEAFANFLSPKRFKR